jgi:seryl-tRNA synthetase
MLDIKFISENTDIVKWACEVKGIDDHTTAILELDKRVRELKTLTETKTAEKNKLTKQIPSAANKAELVEESKKIGLEIESEMKELADKESELNDLLLKVPQIPKKDTPIGADDSFNVVTKQVGTPTKFDFTPRPHWEIMDMNHWWMPEKISEICGTRTYCLMGEAAELDLAVQTYVLQKLMKKGFTFVQVPAITKTQAIFDAGHFRGSDASVMKNDVFMLNDTDRCLAGTAEIILNSLHRNEILDEKDLPLMYAGFSPCFRKEAGAAGRDTRGLVRFYEFNKVEQYVYCTLEKMDEMHQFILSNLCEVMEEFEVPYQVIANSTGDMGFNKVEMHDVEAWFPNENKYREVGSCSSIGEFQARRTNTRYRTSDGTVKFCATLNNTAIALPRALVPILENHQNADGSVNIPRALQPLMGGRTKIGK